jgi:hypothetical protein
MSDDDKSKTGHPKLPPGFVHKGGKPIEQVDREKADKLVSGSTDDTQPKSEKSS